MVIKNFNDTLIEFRKIRKELDSLKETDNILEAKIKNIPEPEVPETQPPDVIVIPGGDNIEIKVNGELVE